MTFQIQSKKTLFITIIYLCMFVSNLSLHKIINTISSKYLLFLVAIMMQITAEGIICFKCYASQPGHEKTDLLCSQFDESPRFQVHCPSSTLCRKRTIYSKYKSK